MNKKWIACCFVLGLGCEDTPGGPIAGLQSITVDPANQTLTIDGNTPATSTYRAMGTFTDGHMEDITSRVGFRVDVRFGSFNGGQFTSTTAQGGMTTIYAESGNLVGAAALTLILRQRFSDPGPGALPGDPAAAFAGPANASRAPELVYPNDGVLVPPNLRKLEFHFRPGTSNTLFELSLTNALTDIKVYLRCPQPMVGGGCIYQPPPNVWAWIAETNRGGQPVRFSARGTDDTGTAVGSSAELALSISKDNLQGAIYYWTTSSGTAIMRLDFASQTMTTPERFLDGTATDGSCIGCHVLTRDGKYMAATTQGGYDGRILLYDVARTSAIVPFGQPAKSVFESWNPQGTRYVGVYASSGATNFNPIIFDGMTGMALSTIDVGAVAGQPTTHPDWSPDGRRIVFVRIGQNWSYSTLARFLRGSIEVVTDMAGTWAAPQVLVAANASKNFFYPTFSPDGGFLVYDESTCAGTGNPDTSCNGYEDPSAKMMALALDRPGAQPVALSKANGPGINDGSNTNLTNSFPKWSPFVFQRTSEALARLEWITFSSSRKYGLRPPPPGGAENSSGTLLWMAGVDPDKVGTGNDPSYPAFALPFQDLATSNHTAQWATRLVPAVQ